jgi:cytochrome c oxidase assembly factor CtaG
MTRIALLLSGCVLLAAGLSLSGEDPRTHMAQHLLLGMLAPLGLVMGAPVTLLLRKVPPIRRPLARVLRSTPVHVLAHPVTAALLSTGGLYAVLLTPIDLPHHLLHLHYLAAGCLFTWAIAGPDPAPRRPGVRVRAATLVVAGAAHAVLAKYLYAGADDSASRAAAQLLYYGGDLTEVLLAIALFAGWYRYAPVAARRRERRVRPAPAS